MLKHIFIREITSHFKGFKFNIVFISCIVLLGFNHLVMYQNYESKLKDAALTFPWGKPVQKEAEPLSVYVTGTNELLDRVFQMDEANGSLFEMHAINTDIFRQYFPLIDFNYLVRVILSFLAMVVGFDAFCGEKQQGTLKLMLSNSVKRSTVVLGKIWGNLFTLLVPLIFSSLLYYTILSIKPTIHFSASDNIRLLLILLASLIYLSIFLLISLAVSASSGSITESIIKNFIIWATIIFIIPNPSTLFFNGKDKLPDGRKISDLIHIRSAEYAKTMPDSDAKEKAFFDYTSNVLDYRNKLNKKIRAAEWTSLVIPSDAYNLCVTSLSKCGLNDEDHFRKAILQYQQGHSSGKASNEFSYNGIDLISSIRNCIKYYASLVFSLLIVTGIAINRFKHYDIR